MNRDFNNLDLQTARIYIMEMLDVYREVLGRGIFNNHRRTGSIILRSKEPVSRSSCNKLKVCW